MTSLLDDLAKVSVNPWIDAAPISFADQWQEGRTLVSARKLARSGLALSIDAKGGVRSSRALKKLLAEITANETSAFSNRFGEASIGPDALKAIRSKWVRQWKRMNSRVKRFTYHLILGFPKGADPFAAECTAENFACMFAGHYDYVLVHHHETNLMCTHLVLNRFGRETLTISPYAISIDVLRGVFLEASREAGLILPTSEREIPGEEASGND